MAPAGLFEEPALGNMEPVISVIPGTLRDGFELMKVMVQDGQHGIQRSGSCLCFALKAWTWD